MVNRSEEKVQRHNIHMNPYFLFAAIHHLKSSPTFSVRPFLLSRQSNGGSTPEVVGSTPTEVKNVFFASSMWFPVSLY